MSQKTEASTWKQWLMPRRLDWLAAFFYLGVLGVYINFYLSGLYRFNYPWLGGLGVFLGILLMMGLDRLEYWYQEEEKLTGARQVGLLAGRFILIGGLSLTDGLGFPHEAFVGLTIFFGAFLFIGRSFGLTGLIWAFYLIERVKVTTGSTELLTYAGHDLVRDITFSVTTFLILAFIFSVAYTARRERKNRLRVEKLLYDLETSHRQLQEYASQVAELATIEERNRLARDIHDSLGHYMTVINVQLEKAIAFRDRNPAQADQAVKEAKRLASEALKEVRRSVSALRDAPEPFSLVQALSDLANNMRTSQFSIELEIKGEETGFSRQSLITLFRAAQEGLTNIQKHAGASQVIIRVQLDPTQATLSITDNGCGFDPATLNGKNRKAHFGLQGVRERLELIRGSLKLESTPGQGTTLFIVVPKTPLTLAGKLWLVK